MNLLVDIIGYIGAAIAGAVCLELFWYERRRRKHQKQDAQLENIKPVDACPACGGYGSLELNGDDCAFCDGKGTVLFNTEKDNPPPQDEKEK